MIDMDRYLIEDRALICVDCGREFAFTVEEQRFHRGFGWADPLRCAACLADTALVADESNPFRRS